MLGPYALLGGVPLARARSSAGACPTSCSGFGGFASFPGGLMGTAAGKPLVLHDANAVAGTRHARARAWRRPHPPGVPAGAARQAREDRRVGGQPDARRDMRAAASCRTLCRTRTGRCACSSSAAASARRRSTTSCPRPSRGCRASARPHVVHQAGEKHIAALSEAYARHAVDAECVAFIDDMAARYAWADFVICRGGALTISELAAVGLGALVVPLPGAIADEQSANARFLVDAQAAWLEPQGTLTAERPRSAPAVARPRGCARHGAGGARARQARRGGACRRRLHRTSAADA